MYIVVQSSINSKIFIKVFQCGIGEEFNRNVSLNSSAVPLNFHNSSSATTLGGNTTATPTGHTQQQHLQQSHLDSGATPADNNTITAESPTASTTTCMSPGQLQQQQHNANNNGSSGNGVVGASATALHSILGSTPLSQIGCGPLNLEQYSGTDKDKYLWFSRRSQWTMHAGGRWWRDGSRGTWTRD